MLAERNNVKTRLSQVLKMRREDFGFCAGRKRGVIRNMVILQDHQGMGRVVQQCE